MIRGSIVGIHNRALPHLRCPEIDWDAMARLIDFAIRTNFGWPREPTTPARHDIHGNLSRWLSRPQPVNANGDRSYVSLRVSGSGGGQWHLVLSHGQLVAAGTGLRGGDGATCHLTSDTFTELIDGRMSCEAAINAGKLVVAGGSVQPCEIARLFRTIKTDDSTIQVRENE